MGEAEAADQAEEAAEEKEEEAVDILTADELRLTPHSSPAPTPP